MNNKFNYALPKFALATNDSFLFFILYKVNKINLLMNIGMNPPKGFLLPAHRWLSGRGGVINVDTMRCRQ